MILFFIWQIFMASICRLGAIIDVRQRAAELFCGRFSLYGILLSTLFVISLHSYNNNNYGNKLFAASSGTFVCSHQWQTVGSGQSQVIQNFPAAKYRGHSRAMDGFVLFMESRRCYTAGTLRFYLQR